MSKIGCDFVCQVTLFTRENRTRIAHPHRHTLLIVSYCLVVRSLLRQLFLAFRFFQCGQLHSFHVCIIICLEHGKVTRTTCVAFGSAYLD